MDAQKFIKIKDIFVRKDKIEFFYYTPEDETLYIGMKNNYFAIELQSDVDDIPGILNKLESMFDYTEIG